MGALRKLERQLVKGKLAKEKKNVKRNFTDAWDDFRDKKYITKDDEGNIVLDKTPKNTMRKKQQHFDNVEQYNRFFAHVEEMKRKAAKEDTTRD